MRRLLKARELGLPEGDLSTLEDDARCRAPVHRPRRRSLAAPADAPASAASRSVRRALQRGQDPRLPAPLHRRGGRRRRRDASASSRRRRRRDLPRARPRPGPGHAAGRGHGRDVRQGEGCSRGRGGSMHLFDAARRASTAATPSSAAACRSRSAWPSPTACGAAPASPPASSARARSPRASSTSRINLAALWQLPVLFFCENNLYAMGTALEPHRGRDRPRAARPRPTGSGVGRRRHGRRSPSRRRRAGPARDPRRRRPCFLELRTYRFRAHSMYDPELYRDKAEIERWKERDPIDAPRERGCGPTGELDDDDLAGTRGRGRRRDRRRGRLRRGRHRWSPSRT